MCRGSFRCGKRANRGTCKGCFSCVDVAMLGVRTKGGGLPPRSHRLAGGEDEGPRSWDAVCSIDDETGWKSVNRARWSRRSREGAGYREWFDASRLIDALRSTASKASMPKVVITAVFHRTIFASPPTLPPPPLCPVATPVVHLRRPSP